MSTQHRQGLLKRAELAPTELAEVEHLLTVCNQAEGLHIRLAPVFLGRREPTSGMSFLYYEQDRLVGLLDLYGAREPELTGMVEPRYRRRGIFRHLLQAAREACAARREKRLLLINETASASGKAFLLAVGARQDHAEHAMVLAQLRLKGSFDDRLLVRPAESDDLPALAAIMAVELQTTPETALVHLTRLARHPWLRYYVATLGGEDVGCAEPVGLLRVEDLGDEYGIYGFVMHPAYRGRGYGRQLLEEVVLLLQRQSQRPIMLEVDTTNEVAIGLYRSCGFVVRTTYDYYSLAL
jgi:ribosomal protein S18 acetylase RimI-like enzyme